MKTIVRLVGLICVVTLAWAIMPLAATASFTSEDKGAYILWSQDSTHTYYQQFKADYRWYGSTTTNPSDFNYMGKLADMSTLLFDGSYHKFTDNNYSYEFWDSSAMGVWQNQNASLNVNQYAYDYNLGQWYDQGNWGGWATLGTTGLSTAFMGNGSSQNLGNNWNYLFDGTYGYWNNGSPTQFAYNYSSGQWCDQGNWGGWATLGSNYLSASFVGDGISHTLGSSWSYLFDGSYGYWQNGNMSNLQQFAYNYTTGNWYDQGNWGGWATLGSAGLSPSFMGDTTSHTLGSNWSYLFDGSYGYWQNGNMNTLSQFTYNYNTGQWFNQGNWGGWQYLGPFAGVTPLSAAFIGDGSSYDIGVAGATDWLYHFDGTYGYWHNQTLNLDQFAYNYSTGWHYDQGQYGGWAGIGYANTGAYFLGSGYFYNNPTNPWGYQYNGTLGWGEFWRNINGGFWMMAYDYNTGQWYEQGQGSSGGWQLLGPTQLSASFMADGNSHQLDANWSFQAVPGVGGLFTYTPLGLALFKYQYTNGQWFDQGQYGGWIALSDSGASAAFMGDGTSHTLGNNWSYLFDGTYGYWENGNLGNMKQFAYDYTAGVWWNQGLYASSTGQSWFTLGPLTGQSSAFRGDGSAYDIGIMGSVDWTYRYDGTYGYWHNQTLNLDQFAYNYNTGWHYDQGQYGGWASIGYANTGAYFLGSGYFYNNPTIPVGYQYNGTLGWGEFYCNSKGVWEYAYDYNTGQWYDQGGTTGWNPLGPSQLSALYMGDGNSHQLDANWSYQLASDGSGEWTYIPLGLVMFKYNISSTRWFDQGQYNGWASLSNTGTSSALMGDGNAHDLGIINGIDWSYLFDGTYGYWENGNMNNLKQFAYNYTTGIWSNQGNYGGWQFLGPFEGGGALSAAFIGDGSSYDIHVSGGVDWTYRYDGTYGYWHNQTLNLDQFAYNYSTGWHYDQGQYGGWAGIGYANTGAYFLGSGYFYNNPSYPWGYQYNGTLGWGEFYWTRTGVWDFAYDFNTGQWYDQGGTTGWNPLGPTQMSAWFLGDGNSRQLDANWSYRGVSNLGGIWSYNGVDVLRYGMGTGQWFDQGPTGGWIALSDNGISSAFLGDGNQHFLGTGTVGNGNYYAFRYTPEAESGVWWIGTSSDPPYWAYGYSDGQWWQWHTIGSAGAGWYQYGSPGQSAALPAPVSE